MKPQKNSDCLESRVAQKKAARRDDEAAIRRGVSREEIQKDNSVVSRKFVANAKMRNLRQAIGA